MSVLLLTMGPPLGLVMDTPNLRVGEPGTITLRAPGALGDVKWAVVASDLPAEWGAITPDGAEATINTAEALVWGDYTLTVRAVDSQRIPVARTFSVWVEPDAIVVTGPSTLDLVAGAPATGSYAITGGTGVYVSAHLEGAPASISAGISGASAVLSGSPTGADVGTGSGRIVVKDSRGAQGATSFVWEVTNPPKILISGDFVTVLGASRDRAARLNADGTLDAALSVTWANPTRGLAVDPQGRIMIARTGIERLLIDGTKDPSWTDPGTDGVVQVILPLSDGRYVIGGGFTQVGGVGRSKVAILHNDGSLDTSFVPPTNNGEVLALAVDGSGRVICGGNFNAFQGGICRLLANGAHDTGFVTPWEWYDGAIVYAIAIQSDGKILVAGNPVSRLTRLNTDGSSDTSWTYNSARIFNALALDEANGVVYVGSDNDPQLRRHLLANGAIDTSFTPSLINPVYSIAIQPDGKVIAAGDQYMDGSSGGTNSIRRYATTGVADGTFGANVTNSHIRRVVLQVSP